MSNINGIGGQIYVAPQTNKTQTTAKQSSARATADYYVPSGSSAVQTETKAKAFTAAMASELAGKYDVRNMSRNEYTKLLAKLRDSGVLTAQEYSAAYGGTMPTDEGNVSWPHGSESTDFVQLLQDCEASCADYAANSAQTDGEKVNGEMLTAAYSRLQEIFQQIGGANQAEAAQSAVETEATAAHDKGLSHFEATSAVKEYSDEVMRLYELLKQDEEYVSRAEKTANLSTADWDYPVREQLVKELLLSDNGLMEEFAMYTWGLDVEENLYHMECNATINTNYRLIEVEPSYEDRIDNYKYKLLHGGKEGFEEVFGTFEGYLRNKASYQRLTEVERLACPRAAANEKAVWYTFEERMEPVMDEVRNAFSDAGLTFDTSKNYQFHLDTSTFTFSVTGGTDDENAVFASVLNNNPTESYKFNPYKTTINAIQFSRPDDMSYAPWRLNKGTNYAAKYNAKFFNLEESIQKYGIANISAEYTAKMEQFDTAYRRDTMDDNLQRRFGFGIDDFTYENGRWIGRTDEITKLIEDMNKYADWDKQIGDAYRDLIKEYTGTPTFEKPVFVFINGELKLTYEEWE